VLSTEDVKNCWRVVRFMLCLFSGSLCAVHEGSLCGEFPKSAPRSNQVFLAAQESATVMVMVVALNAAVGAIKFVMGPDFGHEGEISCFGMDAFWC